jgi:hypothetical protein
VITSDSRDFRRLGSPLLNVAMFASLIVGYGLAVAALADWFERVSRDDTARRGRRAGAVAIRLTAIGVGVVGALAATLLSVAIVTSASPAIAEREMPSLTTIVYFLALFVALPLARLAVALPDRVIAARLGGPGRVRQLALFALGLVVG